MKAHVKIFEAVRPQIFPNTGTPVQEYDLEYNDAKELNGLFQEARKVWDEFDVEVEFMHATMSESHTYAEQVAQELS